jgi:hypothetical protein
VLFFKQPTGNETENGIISIATGMCVSDPVLSEFLTCSVMIDSAADLLGTEHR